MSRHVAQAEISSGLKSPRILIVSSLNLQGSRGCTRAEKATGSLRPRAQARIDSHQHARRFGGSCAERPGAPGFGTWRALRESPRFHYPHGVIPRIQYLVSLHLLG